MVKLMFTFCCYGDVNVYVMKMAKLPSPMLASVTMCNDKISKWNSKINGIRWFGISYTCYILPTIFMVNKDYHLDKISQTGTEWHVDCMRWCVVMETRCRIPIWRTFGRIQWRVIPEPRITLQGAATVLLGEFTVTSQGTVTWQNQCRDPATLQGVRIPFAILKIVFRHILFLLF